jgi:hypothetical protein
MSVWVEVDRDDLAALGAAVAALNEAGERRSAAQLERLVARAARAIAAEAQAREARERAAALEREREEERRR